MLRGAGGDRPLPVADIFEAAGIEMIPRSTRAPSPTAVVEEKAYLHFENKILDVLRANPDVDGIWMFCHGHERREHRLRRV